MSHAAIHWVINEIVYPKDVKPQARWLLIHLADRASREGWECWPSHKLLAADAGMSVRSVVDLLFVLESAELIARTEVFRPDGKRSTDTINLLSGYATVAPGTDRNMHDDRVRPATKKVTKAAEQNHVTETGKGTVSVVSAPDPFDAWWTIYPRKAAKVAARKAWATLPAALAKHGQSLAHLMERTQAFADHVVGKDPDKIAHPATWLNGERWNDELPTRSQTDGRTRDPAVDYAAERHQARVGAVVAGIKEAADGGGRRRWRL